MSSGPSSCPWMQRFRPASMLMSNARVSFFGEGLNPARQGSLVICPPCEDIAGVDARLRVFLGVIAQAALLSIQAVLVVGVANSPLSPPAHASAIQSGYDKVQSPGGQIRTVSGTYQITNVYTGQALTIGANADERSELILSSPITTPWCEFRVEGRTLRRPAPAGDCFIVTLAAAHNDKCYARITQGVGVPVASVSAPYQFCLVPTSTPTQYYRISDRPEQTYVAVRKSSGGGLKLTVTSKRESGEPTQYWRFDYQSPLPPKDDGKTGGGQTQNNGKTGGGQNTNDHTAKGEGKKAHFGPNIDGAPPGALPPAPKPKPTPKKNPGAGGKKPETRRRSTSWRTIGPDGKGVKY
ncbi:hypothetical protein GLOTRDRAFT_95926 [Gloeophyllum trabeum ATCC 11539]|uniref:Uncharacterized protein n=1 Tax=Gloeophyllum trabeum (strain ATCC 11539 / FP-39264 / Madison 617) TaxID=670483 RepID=S7PXS1_GLOTA|nr:uncharacterized protein GLOTRDRAFT_95926 [Gloeophyllum trabeum ATCC 11539]EPQ52313.1 hypothetical protein GLOTRDRAFT_95926 [Gloeophyllum trabeum ATCC 11539]